jgi:hypothetical protein
MTSPTLSPAKADVPANGNGHGHNGDGHPGEPPPDALAAGRAKRTSFWPFVMDVGLVMALFGLIITGRFLIVIGAVVFVIALLGWLREAREDFARLSDG